MAKKKIGDLIREARTNASMSQAQLSRETGVSASDISKAERHEKELTTLQLKAIAKATGVTQKSLLEAASGSTTSKASTTSMQLTTTEKRLVELYRKADTDTKKAALAVLKGTPSQTGDILSSLFKNKDIMNMISSLMKED